MPYGDQSGEGCLAYTSWMRSNCVVCFQIVRPISGVLQIVKEALRMNPGRPNLTRFCRRYAHTQGLWREIVRCLFRHV